MFGSPGCCRPDAKTTQIYSHYAPSEQEVAIVNAAFSVKQATGSNLRKTGQNSEAGSVPEQAEEG